MEREDDGISGKESRYYTGYSKTRGNYKKSLEEGSWYVGVYLLGAPHLFKLLYELRSILMVSPEDLDPIKDCSRGHATAPMQNPVSALNMAPLRVVSTVAHMKASSGSSKTNRIGRGSRWLPPYTVFGGYKSQSLLFGKRRNTFFFLQPMPWALNMDAN